MSPSRLVRVVLVAGALLATATAASAKEFRPGDLRICNERRCVPIMRRAVLPLIGRFYYSTSRLRTARPAPTGGPSFYLEFTNDYVTGIVATSRLDRFLSFGVNVGRFERGRWYELPVPLTHELARLSAHLEPVRLSPRLLSRAR